MPTISQSRKTEITDALLQHGVVANEEAIAFVVNHLKENGRATVNSAARKYAEEQGQNHQTPQQPRQAMGSIQNQVLDKAARKLADQWKATIENRAMSYLLADIEAGAIGLDFEHQLVESFAAFGEAIEVESRAIAGGHPSPFLLESSTTPEDAASCGDI